MSNVRKALLEHKEKTRKDFEREMADIDAALKALDMQEIARGDSKALFRAPADGGKRHENPMPINEAIIQAVGNGNGTPPMVFGYLKKIGVTTTINSVHVRLSKLKSLKKIGHDGTHWVPLKKSGPDINSPVPH